MLVPYDSYETAQLEYDEGNIWSIKCCTKCIAPLDWMNVMSNHEFITWLQWVNVNICLTLEKDTLTSFNTTAVKLRIATGMLNNIQSLTDLEKIQIHSNLTTNVNEEKSRIIYGSLPF